MERKIDGREARLRGTRKHAVQELTAKEQRETERAVRQEFLKIAKDHARFARLLQRGKLAEAQSMLIETRRSAFDW